MAWSPITDNLHRGEDLPIIGDDISQIGRIMDLWGSACSPDPVLWVQAFFHAAPTAFWSAFKPELWDIDIADKRHRKRRHPALRFLPKLGISDALVQVQVPRWTPFVISEAIDRALFYFLIADALEDLAINWMSLAYQWQGCTGDFPVWCQRTMSDRTVLISNNPDEYIIWGDTQSQGCATGINWVQPLIGQSIRCACEIESRPHPTFTPAGNIGEVQIVDLDTGKTMADNWPSALLTGWSSRSASAYFRNDPGTPPRVGVRVGGEPGFVEIMGSGTRFDLAGDTEDTIAPDP